MTFVRVLGPILSSALSAALTVGAVGTGVFGCQLVAGIEDRTEDTVGLGCTLPQEGDHQVRLANLRPSTEGVDVCIKPSGETEYRRPLFRDAGEACQQPSGAAFKQVTGVFRTSGGTVDVRVLPAGTTKCEGTAPIAEGRVELAAEGVTTLAVLGGGGGSAVQVKALPERAGTAGGSLLRFVNAVGSGGNLKFGVASEARLPTTMAFFVQPNGIPLGGTLSEGPGSIGSVDAKGYLELLAQITAPYGAAREDSNDALLVTTAVPPIPSTLYAIGEATDPLFPIRGLVCADSPSTDPFIPCTESDPPSVSVDVFTTGLIGLFGAEEAVRRPQLPGAIAGRPSDLLCLTELGNPADRKLIIEAAKNNFPYSYEVESNYDTPFDDPSGLDGTVPTPPDTPPCQGYESALDTVLACGKEKCSTLPNDGNGRPTAGTCITTQCVAAFSPLVLSAEPQARRCVVCAQAGILSSETWDYDAQNCKTNPRGGQAFRGSTPSLILSRYPLTKTAVKHLPSTTIRRAVLAATIQLELGVELDYYCAHFVAAQTSALPYTGQYGEYSFDDSDRGWFGEQKVQAKQLIDFVRQRSGDRRAIVAGDFQSSIAVPASNIVDRNPEVMQLLRSTFQEAVPPGYVPECTACEPPKNPYGKGKSGFWGHSVFLSNFAPSASVSASRFFTESTITRPDGTLGPVSPYFGFNTRILRR